MLAPTSAHYLLLIRATITRYDGCSRRWDPKSNWDPVPSPPGSKKQKSSSSTAVFTHNIFDYYFTSAVFSPYITVEFCKHRST